MWTFFLSTNSSVASLVRDPHKDPFSRIMIRELARVESLYALQTDVGMVREMTKDAAQVRHILHFSTIDHTLLFGRLFYWRVYTNMQFKVIRDVALCKLLCSSVPFNYDPEDEGHVFATLAARVSLDPCSTTVLSPNVKRLVSTAVGRHLRLIFHMYAETSALTTTTPSEPVVSDAVAAWFFERPRESPRRQ